MAKELAQNLAADLANAVRYDDADTALRLLEDAGGACQARALAKAAVEKADFLGVQVDYSLNVNRPSDTETLTMSSSLIRYGQAAVVILTQPECKQ